ncbi:MAG: DNA polymerase, partial [Anaerolineales bacterium]
DLLQLVDDRIIVNLPGRTLSDARDYLAQDVVEYMGVRPDQIVDFKALVGDKSDNIPGIVGIGEKTAASLLGTYGTLEGIYNHLDELSAGVRKKLEEGRESALLSRELASIVTNLDISLNLEQARPDQFDPAKVEELFRELEFRTLIERFDKLKQQYGMQTVSRQEQLNLFDRIQTEVKPADVPLPSPAIKVDIVDTPDKLDDLVETLNHASRISFDTETTSTDQMQADLVGISLAVDGQQGYYIPVGHQPDLGAQLSVQTVTEALSEPMTNPRIAKVGHNLKYDFVLLDRNGLRVSPLSFDSMIAEWLSNPNSRNLGLKNLAWVRLDHRMTEIVELIGKGKRQISMAEVPIRLAADYAGDDAAVVLRLLPELEAELVDSQAMRLFQDVEMPLVSVLADMEMAGISLDSEFLVQMSAELSQRLADIEAQVYLAAGTEFNLNSPQQLSEVLFERLQ